MHCPCDLLREIRDEQRQHRQLLERLADHVQELAEGRAGRMVGPALLRELGRACLEAAAELPHAPGGNGAT